MMRVLSSINHSSGKIFLSDKLNTLKCQQSSNICIYLIGPTRGHCNCGVCMCVPGYIGSACECLNSTKYCLAKNGKLCNGLGQCECGKCICNKDNKYMGPTCEDCPVSCYCNYILKLFLPNVCSV